MLRQLSSLSGKEFDLLVIGGGVVGACVAWDAAQRGLSVALVERRDFGAGTSANSLKIVHGGLRYLQRLDLRTMRESIRERRTWLRIAPHLVEPLPFVIPDYGDARENRALLRTALLLNDLLSADRSRDLASDRTLPAGRLLTAAECRERVPTLPPRGLRGGVLFYDAQMYSTERLVLEVVRAAAMAGAVVLNYVEMVSARAGEGGLRVELQDGLSGERLQTRAKFLVNATGPWLPATIQATGGGSAPPRYAAALNLVVHGSGSKAGVAVSARGRDAREDFRRLFMVPWRGRSLIGTAHYHLEADASPEMDPEPLVQRFMDEVNRALPDHPLHRDDVMHVHFGLLPVEGSARDASASLRRHAQLLEHSEPIISVASVKYTGARALAERVVDRVFRRLGWPPPRSRTRSSLLPGAPAEPVSTLLADAHRRFGDTLEAETLEHLVRSYGRGFQDLVRRAQEDPDCARRVMPDSPVLVAQLEHGVEAEMAVRAEDLLYRRTELGAVGSITQAAEREAEAALARNTSAVHPLVTG